jgi:peptidoglycan lytic transglycosylase G
MSPPRGRNAGGSQTPPRSPSDDWAGDLEWIDPHAPASASSARPGLRAAFMRWATEHERGPRDPRRRRYLLRRLVALAVIAVLAFAAWFLIELYQPLHGGGGAKLTVSIPPDSSGSSVGKLLAADGVVSSSFFFDLRASLAGDSDKFRSGVYTLRKDMSYGAALSALTSQSGGAAEISLTIPEGDTRAQIAQLARKAGLRGNYMKASTAKAAHFSPQAWGAHKGVKSLEGFLFPDTYYLYRHGWVGSLVQKQLAAFKQNFAAVRMSYARSKNLTDYDVITIASIIEREAQLSSDGPKVAEVVYNRLAQGIPLGLDTTLLYYLHDPKGGLTSHDLQLKTPYNTRLHYGLPPTPIANPGLEALDHAAHPSHGSYLYFVVKPNDCGALAFSSDQTTFDEDVAVYNAAVKANHGAFPGGCPSSKKQK